MIHRPFSPGAWLFFVILGCALAAGALFADDAQAAPPPFEIVVDSEAPTQAVMASFSYRIDGDGRPRITASTTDAYLFCANAGFDRANPASMVRLQINNRSWRFGDVSVHGQPLATLDVRWFRYTVRDGRPNLFVSSVLRGSSLPGSLVCLEASAAGRRSKRWNSMFKDGFEPEPSLFKHGFEWHIDHDEPDIPFLNSSVRVDMGARYSVNVNGMQRWYQPYKITARVPPLGAAAAYVIRDGFDTELFEQGFTTWCALTTDPGFNLRTACNYVTPNYGETVDYSPFTLPYGQAREYYVVVERRIAVGASLSRGKPVVAAALFPDPALQEQYLRDNVAFGFGY